MSLTAAQESKLAEVQRLADRITSLYGVPSVRIYVQSATNLKIGAVYRQGNIYVNVRMLDSPNLTKTIRTRAWTLGPGARQRHSAHSRPSSRQRGARGPARSLSGRSDRGGRPR